MDRLKNEDEYRISQSVLIYSNKSYIIENNMCTSSLKLNDKAMFHHFNCEIYQMNKIFKIVFFQSFQYIFNKS